MRSARVVARSRGILEGAAAALDIDSYAPAGWRGLVDDGAVARLDLTNGMVDEALRAQGAEGYGPEGVRRDAGARFIEFYAAVATALAVAPVARAAGWRTAATC
ncbi:MAG: hypothetical protein V3U93_07425 [Alphaproteobacteria bacterium]